MVLCVLAACGDASLGGRDAAPLDGGSSDAASLDATLGDMGPPPPEPEPREPCVMDRCWDTALATPRCVRRSIDEDFSSGSYDAHDWATVLWAGVPTTVTVAVSAGDWQPAVLVLESDGRVLFDGATGRTESGLTVDAITDGRSGAVAEVRLTSGADRAVSVFVTSWAAVESSFANGPPTSADYTLTISGSCPGMMMRTCMVNGYEVGDPACAWIHYVGLEVVNRLEGTRAERLDAAAAVTWWALKEGVLSLSNPIAYSNCNFPEGDMHIGPLEVCADGRAWQVGMSAVQVPGRELSTLEASARTLFGMEPDAVLELTALEAALDDGDRAAVVASTGDLRRSWLLRTTAIGFTLQAPTVTRECITETRTWCYGTGWFETMRYAPDRDGALTAVADIRALLDGLAP